MSNIDTVKAMYEAFGRGDVPSILEKMSDDVRWEEWADNTAQKRGVPWLKPRRGKEGVADFFRLISEFAVKEFQVLSIMGGGNQVAAEFVFEADAPPHGRHYRDEEIHLWTFDEQGKVIRLRHYADTAKHMAVAGV